MNYQQKYLKYKIKYINLKKNLKMAGGNFSEVLLSKLNILYGFIKQKFNESLPSFTIRQEPYKQPVPSKLDLINFFNSQTPFSDGKKLYEIIMEKNNSKLLDKLYPNVLETDISDILKSVNIELIRIDDFKYKLLNGDNILIENIELRAIQPAMIKEIIAESDTIIEDNSNMSEEEIKKIKQNYINDLISLRTRQNNNRLQLIKDNIVQFREKINKLFDENNNIKDYIEPQIIVDIISNLNKLYTITMSDIMFKDIHKYINDFFLKFTINSYVDIIKLSPNELLKHSLEIGDFVSINMCESMLKTMKYTYIISFKSYHDAEKDTLIVIYSPEPMQDKIEIIAKNVISIHMLFRKINIELSNFKPFNIIIYLSPLKRTLPPNNKIYSAHEINGGATNIDNYIEIFREEEMFKVLLHEHFHAYKIVNVMNLGINTYNLNTYAPNSKPNINFNETIIESITLLLNTIFVSDTFERFIENLKNEIRFIFTQAGKILNYSGFSNWMEYFNKSTNPEKTPIIEYTNLHAYYILKTQLLFDLEGFINNIFKENLSLNIITMNGCSSECVEHKKDDNGKSCKLGIYCKLSNIINTTTENEAYISTMNDNIKKEIDNNSMRMTLNEIKFE